MALAMNPNSHPEMRHSIFDGLEKLPTHQKILKVLYFLGQSATGEKIVPPSRRSRRSK